MSKMSELSAMIDNLISCGETLAETGRALKEFYSGTDEAPAKAEKKPKKEAPAPKEEPAPKQYSKEEVRASWQRRQTKQMAASRQMSKRSFRSMATEAALPMWIRRTTRHLSQRWKD